jgi:hypothetical protein
MALTSFLCIDHWAEATVSDLLSGMSIGLAMPDMLLERA